jgi:branched-chain amino acid transport system substrate-binding protein
MRRAALVGFALIAGLSMVPAYAQKQYGPGVSDSEIKIGQTMPFSGPASSFGNISKLEAIYFNMINETGGINGRKITFLALDDAFSPPKAVEQTRKLVEGDNVLAIIGSMGTAVNVAISKYLNNNRVPQIFSASAADKLNDPKNLPWTTTFYIPQRTEARIYAAWLLKNKPDAKIAILYQNDDFGKGYVEGLKIGLGAKAESMIVKELSYDVTWPTVDSQVVSLQASGADVLFHAAVPKFSAQALAKSKALNWAPLQLVPAVSASIVTALNDVGGRNAAGVISGLYLKDPKDSRWRDDAATKVYLEFMKKWAAGYDANASEYVMGYSVAEAVTELFRRCGDDLTRENLIKMATHIDGYQPSMFIPGVTIDVTPDNRAAIHKLQISRYDGNGWIPITDVIGTSD